MVFRLPKKGEDPTREVSQGPGVRLPKGVQVADMKTAHSLLDTPIIDLAKRFEPGMAGMIPADKGQTPLRTIMKESNFMVRGMLMSKFGPHLAKAGVTREEIDKAVNEAPPPREKPKAAEAPKAPPAAAAPVAAPAPAAAAPAKQYALPPTTTPPVTAPTTASVPLPPPAAAPAPKSFFKPPEEPPAAAAPAGGAPGPKGFVTHHTGGNPAGGDWKTPADVVNYWKTSRPGIGTQYIMDRDGKVYDVKKDFGYGGTSHVHPGYTPKEMLDKGLVNKNLLGMEIMARDAKDVTPVQTKAFAEWIQKNHPNLDIYGHGELNPGHKEADEGISAKEAALALRKAGVPPAEAAARAPAVAAEATAAAATEPGEAPSPGTGGKGPGSLDAVQKAFLSTIAKGEAKNYTTIYGGSQFSDMSRHPGKAVTANGYTSTAAGRYQFLERTWREQAAKYGYTDFKPETQDKAAWNYASDTYKAKTGRDMASDLASNDAKLISGVGDALKEIWPSLPGGSQENWKGAKFADVYGQNLGSPLEGSATAVAEGQGGIGSDAARTGEGAAPTATADSGGGFDFGKGAAGVGDAFAGIGEMFAKSAAGSRALPSTPANAPMPSMNPPMGPFPTVDPKAADMQRQQLAQALQRLNSGKLV